MTKANAKASSSRSTLPKQADEVKQPEGAEHGMRWALVPVIGIGVALAAAAIVAAGRAVASRRRAPSRSRGSLLVPTAGIVMAAVAAIAGWRNRGTLAATAGDARGELEATAAQVGREITSAIGDKVPALDDAEGSNGTRSRWPATAPA